jgi:hypothetical protein
VGNSGVLTKNHHDINTPVRVSHPYASAASLNGDCHSAAVDRGALEHALRGQGEDFFRRVAERCPHLFAAAPLFVSAAHVEQMYAVIAAVEQVVALPSWREAKGVLPYAPTEARNVGAYGNTPDHTPRAKGVFFGYDFHLNDDGAHLIEINTNAGGAFLNNLLLQSQSGVALPGEAAAPENLEQVFLDMFRNEWRLERGDAPLQTVAIVDEQPEQQYLYPEFVLAQQMFERAGIAALIADPSELEARTDGLYCRRRKLDLVYNRLTDFYFQKFTVLGAACQNPELAVISPHPHAYALYADKYNLALLTDVDSLHSMGVEDEIISVLQARIPQTRAVRQGENEHWWMQRKQLFFKPSVGFGSKGTYRGGGVTHRVFDEIMRGEYVAQRMAPPGERMVHMEDGQSAALKYDIRCYVYDGQVQLIAARLYQGQTTNFRTAGGGFAQVRIVG